MPSAAGVISAHGITRWQWQWQQKPVLCQSERVCALVSCPRHALSTTQWLHCKIQHKERPSQRRSNKPRVSLILESPSYNSFLAGPDTNYLLTTASPGTHILQPSPHISCDTNEKKQTHTAMPSTTLSALLAPTLFLCFLGLVPTTSATYTLTTSLRGPDLFSSVSFFNATDPTSGYVEYVDYATAAQNKLIGLVNHTTSSAHTQSVYLGVDTTTLSPQPGRASVRIATTASWASGLLIADVRHIPTGCGVWPALWLLGVGEAGTASAWPNNGEIDIIEVVNGGSQNSMTLHTSAGCVVDNATTTTTTMDGDGMQGTLVTGDCDVDATNQAQNAGCSVLAPPAGVRASGAGSMYATAGPGYNAAGGGVWATSFGPSGVTIWYHPRSAIPADISAGRPDPSLWNGTAPVAVFGGAGCDFGAHFAAQQVVVNTDFCGAWAGSGEAWEGSGCAARTGMATCEEFVAARPEELDEAYWLIESIDVYQEAGSKAEVRSVEEVEDRGGKVQVLERHELSGRGGAEMRALVEAGLVDG